MRDKTKREIALCTSVKGGKKKGKFIKKGGTDLVLLVSPA